VNQLINTKYIVSTSTQYHW